MKKDFELCYLSGGSGCYRAKLYNTSNGYYKTVRFLWYSKREIFRKLRNEYGCIVSRDSMKRGAK